ncbi:uncharacterized protein [Venturia canescens]|uniref:uncharacterized protein n=1 Tax=Venturia canescens TaxID=32260 RepID=UPI001C9D2019|nr:uncharacterized protein LOC122410812 [Venturia canescens]
MGVGTCGNPSLSRRATYAFSTCTLEKRLFVFADKTRRESTRLFIYLFFHSLSMVKQQKIVRDAGAAASKFAAGVISKASCAAHNDRKRRAVLRMLSQKHPEVETEPGEGSAKGGGGRNDNGAVTPGSYANGDGSKEFLSTGRTGRRNAMPDILGHHAETGTADLSTRLGALTTEEEHDRAGTSGVGQGEGSSSQSQMG